MAISKLEKQLRQRDARIEAQAARIKELERENKELKKLLVESICPFYLMRSRSERA